MDVKSTSEMPGDRIRRARRFLKLSQQRFADELGISRSYVGDVENGRIKPSDNLIGLITSKFNVDIEWITSGRGEMVPDSTPEQADALLKLHEQKLAVSKGASGAEPKILGEWSFDVPIFDIELSAGHGSAVEDEVIVDYLSMPQRFFDRRAVDPASCGAAIVRGTSMERLLRDGDYVVFDRSIRKIVSDACYAIRVFDDLLIKYVRKLPDGDLEITAENTPAFRPFTIRAVDLEGPQIQIIGRVIGAIVNWP